MSPRRFAFLAVSLAALGAAAGAFAEEETAAPGHTLLVEVWQRPELAQEVVVGPDGRIRYPPLGEVRVEGQRHAAIATRLSDGLTAQLREPAFVQVRRVYPVTVTGAVVAPGRFAFDAPPNLLEAVLRAGGPVAGALLDQVRIYRPNGAGGEIIAANAEALLTGRGDSGAPELRQDDVVHVPGLLLGSAAPGLPAGGGGGGGGGAAGTSGRSGEVVVLGRVARPGLYSIAEGADVYVALALAGGPAPDGDLRRTRVLSRQGAGNVVFEVDVERVRARQPYRGFPVRAGDVVEVPGYGASGLQRTWAGTRSILTLSRDVVSAWLLYETLK